MDESVEVFLGPSIPEVVSHLLDEAIRWLIRQ